jgi:hypothetical protein
MKFHKTFFLVGAVVFFADSRRRIHVETSKVKVKVKIKVKFTLEQAIKAQRGSRGTDLLFL